MAPEEIGPRAGDAVVHFAPFLREPMFWVATFGAAVFRTSTAEPRTNSVVVLTFGTAIFSAVVFTEPVVDYTRLSGGWVFGAAAIVTLTGEHLMRLVMKVAKDPSFFLDLWNKWRGRA